MSGVKRGLGRGLESLIPTDFVDEAFDITAGEDEQVSALRELKLTEVKPDPNQPRQEFRQAELETLARSIAAHGVLAPIVVTQQGAYYRIVAGERRWRASQLAGLETIPAIVRTLTAQNRLELSLIENVQREDLNAIEIATAYAKLKTQFNLTSKQIAERVGKSESAIVNTMRLLNLPESAKQAMVEHGLSEGQLRPLIKATPEVIEEVVPRIIAEGWSARRVEQYVTELKTRGEVRPKRTRQVTSVYAEEAVTLGEKLGVKAEIQVSARGSGKVTLRFGSEAELKELLEKL
jgi:ParB family chromosome partitioning protein